MVTVVDRKSGGFGDYIYWFVGLSTDEKPKASNGSYFVEIDTGIKSRFNKETEAWIRYGNSPLLASIAVETAPTKTSYTEGESFDPTGLIIEVTMSDGNSGYVEYDEYSDYFRFICDDPLTAGTTSVVVCFVENGIARYAPIDIIVNRSDGDEGDDEVTLRSISFASAPTKLEYNAGDALDLTGAVVNANYTDGTSQDVTSECTFSPADGTVLDVDNQRITASYTENGVTKTVWKKITVGYVNS